jgi:YhcH/YjgK/YiaL family protein
MFKFKNFDELTEKLEIPSEAIDFMKGLTADTPKGKYEFGEDCFVNVMACETKDETVIMEAHEIYIDVQYLINGEEKIYYINKKGLEIDKPYTEGGDYALYKFDSASEFITYTSGEGVVFFPEDAHLPTRAVGEPMTVNKAVLKLRYRG